MGMGIKNFLWGRGGDGENLMGTGWGWGQFYLQCHSLVRTPTLLARFTNPPLFDAPTRGIPSEFLDETYTANRRGMVYGEIARP